MYFRLNFTVAPRRGADFPVPAHSGKQMLFWSSTTAFSACFRVSAPRLEKNLATLFFALPAIVLALHFCEWHNVITIPTTYLVLHCKLP
jgi:hypothetical protein